MPTTIELLTLADTAARSNALVTGEVDVIDQVDLKTVSLLGRKPGITIEEGAGPLHYVFPMRSKTAPFDNPDLRKALKYAIDREEMLEKILFGHGVVGNDQSDRAVLPVPRRRPRADDLRSRQGKVPHEEVWPW